MARSLWALEFFCSDGWLPLNWTWPTRRKAREVLARWRTDVPHGHFRVVRYVPETKIKWAWDDDAGMWYEDLNRQASEAILGHAQDRI